MSQLSSPNHLSSRRSRREPDTDRIFTWLDDDYIFLPDPYDRDDLKAGSIVDNLDDMRILNGGEVKQDQFGTTRHFTSFGARHVLVDDWQGESRLQQHCAARRCECFETEDISLQPTAKDFTAAVEDSPGVKDWIRSGPQHRSALVITGIKVAKKLGGWPERFGRHANVD